MDAGAVIGTDAPGGHIASLVVQCLPACQAAVCAEIAAEPHAELGAEAAGKLVVVLEADSAQHILDFIARLQARPGVLAAHLVYHYDDTPAPHHQITSGARYESP